MKRLILALSALLVLTTGCSSGADASGSDDAAVDPKVPTPVAASNTYNDDDVMFLQMTITHSKQGLEIVKFGREKGSAEVKEFANAIDATEKYEVEQMKVWLKGWNKDPNASMDPNLHADHGGLPGTTDDVMADLKSSTGEDFDKKFLTALSGHQGAALELALNEEKKGANPESKDLAKRIKESRSEEVSQCLKMLNPQQ
ncbi:DUF305 domain-containing protein [Pseudonocardiaceae bacterium YIM PH 21723]|nr:DUF305 domain-containing protein [Pseudonocardiaceae bacterium YIM PH 21723]